MAGVLLNSGNLKQYTAIGDEGQPIYTVASQLREAVRLRAGADAADCLAIPRVNDARSMIDWYSPHAGMVVPWSAATDQERNDALQALDSFHQSMLSVTGSINSVSEREKRIIQNLLGKVFHFPDRDCVFLVNGKPVLTFWGFQAGVAAPAQDPFAQLRPVPMAAAASTATAAPITDTTTPRLARPWWLWLLLLLLLAALLFWWLRGCSPTSTTVLPADDSAVVEPAVTEKDPDRVLQTEPDPAEVIGSPFDDTVDGVVDGVQRSWRRVTGQEVVTDKEGIATDGAVASDVVEDGIAADDAATKAVGNDVADGTDGTADISGAGDESLAGEDGAEGREGAQGKEGAESTDSASADDTTTPPTPPTATDPGAANTALGTKMAIPPGATQSGSVKFLDGNWRASGGMQDSATGQPVRLRYQFEDGQAKVTVQRGGGVECEGTSNSSMVGGKLQISEQGTVAKCSDGSTFALPAISCTPDQSGQAQCTGQGKDGQSLPITIRQMP